MTRGTFGRGGAGGLLQDGAFLGFGRVVDADVQQEAVELRFRQRVGAGLLERILRGQHEERFAAAGGSRPA